MLKFRSALLYDQPFSIYSLYYNSPLTTTLNVKKTLFKFKYSLFNNLNSLTTFVDPSYDYTWILGSESDVYFQTRCSLKRLLPYHAYGPML